MLPVFYLETRNKFVVFVSSNSQNWFLLVLLLPRWMILLVLLLQISILLAQWAPGCAISNIFYRVADGLIMSHFILDPLFYVLLRCQRRPCFPNVLKLVFHTCQSHPSDRGSHPTSLAMTDHEHCPSLSPTGEPSCELATAAAV
jgi:hypothetical protein